MQCMCKDYPTLLSKQFSFWAIFFLIFLFIGERNLLLRSDFVEGLTKCYKSAGDKLESSTFHLSRAQTAAQVMSH